MNGTNVLIVASLRMCVTRDTMYVLRDVIETIRFRKLLAASCVEWLGSGREFAITANVKTRRYILES